MAEPVTTLTPPPIQNPIADLRSGLTPRVWARYFQAVRDQVLAGGGGTEGPPGPQGEQGEPGPAGPTGPAGAAATLGPTLTTIEALTGLVDTLIYFTGTDVAALSALTALARTLLAGTTTAAMQGTLGLGAAATQTYEAGTFTVTGTGFTTTVTGTARYIRIGKQVALMLPQLTGTSNAAALTITGIPSALAPVTLHRAWVFAQNAGVFAAGDLYILGAGTTVTVNAPSGGTWTASGAKTVYETSHMWIVA